MFKRNLRFPHFPYCAFSPENKETIKKECRLYVAGKKRGKKMASMIYEVVGKKIGEFEDKETKQKISFGKFLNLIFQV